MKDPNHENMLLAVTTLCSISSDPVTFLRTRALIPCRPGSSKSRALGYTVQWLESEGESYVPRGLADDAGDGPSYTNYGIQITW